MRTLSSYLIIVLLAFLSLGMFGVGLPELIILLIIYPFLAIPWYWMTFKKAGYSGWWSLLLLLPWVYIIVLFVFAFMKWPILKKLENVRRGGVEYEI
ncbi:MAG: hypothetical protein QW404_03175 [Candidatus Nanoarchaeia archaeon]